MQLATGDLADPAAFRNALRGVRTVVHLAGSERDQPGATIEELDGARDVAPAARGRAGGRPALRCGRCRSAPRRTTPRACTAPRRSPPRAVAEARDPDDDARHLARLRARRPPAGAAGAPGAAARGAADRPRRRPHAARVGRGRRRRRARGARARARRATRATSWRARRCSPTAQVVELVLRAAGRRRRLAARPARRAARRPEGRRAARRPDDVRDLGRGADARGADALRARAGGRWRRSACARAGWPRSSARLARR